MSVWSGLTTLGFKVLNALHKSIVSLSRGRIGASAFGMPVIELRTIGRTSGLVHSTMLTVPVVSSHQLVLVASKGGNDHDPDWYLNLLVHPNVEVTMRGKRHEYRARAASPQEKAELWPQVVANYKSYATYQRRTTRNIPLVICEPH